MGLQDGELDKHFLHNILGSHLINYVTEISSNNLSYVEVGRHD